jgi:phage protein D
MSDSGQFLAPEGASGAQVDAFYERILADTGGSPETATQSAKTTAKRIARSKRAVEITMPGRIDIVAGMHVNLTGFRQGIAGKWKIITVRHSVSRSGWITNFTGEAAS